MRSPSVFPSGLATRRLMTVLIPPPCTFSCRRLLRDWAAALAGVEHLHGAVAEVGVDRCAHRRRASCHCSTSRRIHGAASRGWLPRMSSMVRWVHAEAGGESLGVRGVVGGAGLGRMFGCGRMVTDWSVSPCPVVAAGCNPWGRTLQGEISSSRSVDCGGSWPRSA